MTIAMNTYPVCQTSYVERTEDGSRTSENKADLDDKLELQKRNLELQAQYHHQLQRQIQQQKELQQEIQESLSKLNSATVARSSNAPTMSWSNPRNHQTSRLNNASQAVHVKSLDTTSQLEMHQAMQSQMNLHRQVRLEEGMHCAFPRPDVR